MTSPEIQALNDKIKATFRECDAIEQLYPAPTIVPAASARKIMRLLRLIDKYEDDLQRLYANT